LPMVSAGSGATVPDLVSNASFISFAASPEGASPLAPPSR
jgi:hypothetical protein